MFQIIIFVLNVEYILRAHGHTRALDPNYRFINKLISYSENVNGLPFDVHYKPYDLNTRHEAVAPYADEPEPIDARRVFDFISKIFSGKAATTPSTTADPNPVNKGFFKRFTTSKIFKVTKWFTKGAVDNDDRYEHTTEAFKGDQLKDALKILTDLLSDINNKLEKISPKNHSSNGEEDLPSQNEVSNENVDVNSKEKIQETTSENQIIKEENDKPTTNAVSNEISDVNVLENTIRRFYKRQVDNTGNIPVEVLSLSVEKNATEDKLMITTIKPIDLGVIGKIPTQETRQLVYKKNNSLDATNRVQYLNLSEIINELQKKNPKYLGINTSVSLNVSKGNVNHSKIFKVRVKRKVNETGLNVLNRAMSDNRNIPKNNIAESIINKLKANNVTKNEISDKAVTKDDYIQVTPKISCNESQQIPNGRRAYSEDTTSEVKQKLLQYMEETFTEIFDKIQPLEAIKRSFGTQDMYRVGYITANLDTLEVNLRNLKSELESNKDLWSDKKIMDIFDKVMTTNKIVSNLLMALQAYSVHDSTSSQPYVSITQNYYPKLESAYVRK